MTQLRRKAKGVCNNVTKNSCLFIPLLTMRFSTKTALGTISPLPSFCLFAVVSFYPRDAMLARGPLLNMLNSPLLRHCLNDLEWLEWPFYVKFSLLRVIIYLFTLESVYLHMWPVEMCGIRVADRDPQNIWNPRKNYGSFVDATLSEPKANISI